jgi:hypothetical protein
LSIPPSSVWARPRKRPAGSRDVGWASRRAEAMAKGVALPPLWDTGCRAHPPAPILTGRDAGARRGVTQSSRLSFTRTKGQRFGRRRTSSSETRSRPSRSRRRTLERMGSWGSPFPQAARLVKGRGGGPIEDEDTAGSTSARNFLHSTRRWYICWSFQPPSRHARVTGRRTGRVPVNPAEDRWCQVVLSGPPSRRRCSIASGSNDARDKASRRPSRDESPCATSSRCHPRFRTV